ncbi:MAG: APC family permease [Nitrososphaerota archaeon]|nr:APC family permease [Candidatus Bathyarchaeota archaeon]MDW8194490.1 APC family permease [Nitrososphaerota archaeon]
MEKKEVFVRKASGLVRNISAWDAMVLNIMVMAPTAIFVYGVWASALYPGADLPMTALLAVPLSIIVGLFYAVYSAAMPRSGGDYIWISRTLHPAIGFMCNFFLFMVLLSVAGSYVPWFTQWALAPILEALGYTELASFAASTEFTFIFAVIYYLICAAIISRGAKASTIALWIFFILVLVGFAVYVATLLSLGPENFAVNFSAQTGMNYQAVIETAKDAGYPGEFLIDATLLGLAFTYINFLGFNSTIYVAGEIKDVQKSQFIAIIGAVIIFGLISWLGYYATYAGMGGIFVGAISYLAETGHSAYTLPFAEPFFPFLFRYATNTTIYCFYLFTWSMMILAAILTYIMLTVRFVFAWSFDRVIPTALSKVDRRYNSPYMALIFVTIIAIILQAAWLWTPLLSYFAYIVFGWMILQIIASISAIVFPYRRKDIYEKAPAIVRKKIGPIPVLTLLAILSIIIAAWLGYASLSPTMVGAIDPIILAFTFGLYALGLVIYFISSMYHKKTGIPLELSFKEIPPE